MMNIDRGIRFNVLHRSVLGMHAMFVFENASILFAFLANTLWRVIGVITIKLSCTWVRLTGSAMNRVFIYFLLNLHQL